MALSVYARNLVRSRNHFLKVPKRNGYIVLLPEFRDNVLQDKTRDKSKLGFADLTAEKCVSNVGRGAAEFEEKIKFFGSLLQNNKDVDLFETILEPMEEMLVTLETHWSTAQILAFGNQSVLTPAQYNKLHERASIAAASRFISEPIYEMCKELLNKQDAKLNDEERRVLQKFVLEGKLHGLDLKGKSRNVFRFSWNQMHLKKGEYELRVRESIRILSPTLYDYNIVKDLPKYLLQAMAKNPEEPEKGPWVVELKDSIVGPFLKYCPDPITRFKVWETHVNKASVHQESLLQTSSTLEDIRGRLQSKAKDLGYKTYVDLSLETKMAESLEDIYTTFDILLEAARPAQEQEIKELLHFANERGVKAVLQEWDIPYYSQRYGLQKFKFKSEDIKQYLPLPKVLAGLFDLLEMLYSVKIEKVETTDVWHSRVELYNVFDLKRSSTVPMGSFYFDPYVREDGSTKVGVPEDSGSMFAIRSNSKVANTSPISALIFEFSPPTKDQPCLLSIGAVDTLFRKFGRMLQHTLTTVEHSEISGTNFIEWDAQMIPDNLMANWLYEPSVLRGISSHWKTGEPLPQEMIDAIRNQRNYMSGYNLCKEMYLSHMDLEMHSSNEFWIGMMRRLWKKYLVTPLHESNFHVCSWLPVFADNWAAAYYSHLWSKMLAADLFSAFHEVSMNQEEVKKLSHRYREIFLSHGGTYPAGELFRRFRGRDPSPQPLIDSLGLHRANTEQDKIESVTR